MTRRTYTPEMAADVRLPFEPRIAPDERNLVFRVETIGHRTKDRTSTIFVAAMDGSSPPRAITGAESNNTAPVWAPNSRSIAFLSDRAERGTSQIHVIEITGGEALRLTSFKGGAGNVTWSPDGRSLLFTARRKSLAGEEESGSEIKVASERWRPHGMARIAATGGPATVLGPAEGHVWSLAQSPDGNTLAAVVSDTEDLGSLWNNVRLVTCAMDGSGMRELLRLTSFPGKPVWSASGRYLSVIGSRLPHADDTNIYVVDAHSGDVTTLDDRGMTPNWVTFRGDDLLVHSVDSQRTRIDATDVRGAEWEALPISSNLAAGWIDAGGNIDARGQQLALAVARPQRPPDIHVVSGGGASLRLTDLNPHLDSVALADMEHVSWNASDGTQVHGWLMLPPDVDDATRLPLVTAVHGGPTWQWGNWFHGTWHDWGQNLAASGYAVFLPNPRGSTGRGGAFTGSNRFDFGGGDFGDIMSGIDALIERGVADADRLGICGWSYGGFMTAWAVTQTDRFKAAVAGAAPTNWVSKIGTTDIRPYNEWSLGVVNDEPDRVWERSPIRYANRVTTPTLVLHGEADPRVPVTQGAEFYNALLALGVDTEMVSYPRQGHAFHERTFQIDLLKRLVGWFERYMPPTAAANGQSNATS